MDGIFLKMRLELTVFSVIEDCQVRKYSVLTHIKVAIVMCTVKSALKQPKYKQQTKSTNNKHMQSTNNKQRVQTTNKEYKQQTKSTNNKQRVQTLCLYVQSDLTYLSTSVLNEIVDEVRELDK